MSSLSLLNLRRKSHHPFPPHPPHHICAPHKTNSQGAHFTDSQPFISPNSPFPGSEPRLASLQSTSEGSLQDLYKADATLDNPEHTIQKLDVVKKLIYV
jgi:hypothetical protein